VPDLSIVTDGMLRSSEFSSVLKALPCTMSIWLPVTV